MSARWSEPGEFIGYIRYTNDISGGFCRVTFGTP